MQVFFSACDAPIMNPETIETQPSEAMAQAHATRNPIKKIYFWTLHWADTPYALPMLVLLSFAESSFFPVPPDVLLMALCFSTPTKWFKLALWCTVASVLGGMLGYYIGWGLYEGIGQRIVDFYHGQPVIDKVQVWYNEYGFFGILVAAVTPIPYKVFTIASGMLHFDFLQFTFASVIGRGFRFFLVAGLIRMFGKTIKPFLEKHFEWLMMAGLALVILGFVAIKFLK